MIDEAVCARIIARLIHDEVGDDPNDAITNVGDGAGITAYGQTPIWLKNYGFAIPLTREAAAANYRAFLALTHLDRLTSVGEWLALAVFTIAINETPSVAIRGLQKLAKVAQDGLLGDETYAAVAHADVTRLTVAYVLDRVEGYAQIVQAHPDELEDLRGWLRRQHDILRSFFGIAS